MGDSDTRTREIQIYDNMVVHGYPLVALDVLSFASQPEAPNVRFDFARGESAGTRAGRKVSRFA